MHSDRPRGVGETKEARKMGRRKRDSRWRTYSEQQQCSKRSSAVSSTSTTASRPLTTQKAEFQHKEYAVERRIMDGIAWSKVRRKAFGNAVRSIYCTSESGKWLLSYKGNNVGKRWGCSSASSRPNRMIKGLLESANEGLSDECKSVENEWLDREI